VLCCARVLVLQRYKLNMAAVECSAFSEDGKYFGYCGVDGKLKVWETETGVLSQEYTPDLHLSSPCTCLAWLASRNSVSHVEHRGNKTLNHHLFLC
jgi:WD40 repeat protein